MSAGASTRYVRHAVTLQDIDEDAHRVVRRLHQTGYEAFLVGGSVRDLLLGKRPKDFDIVTGAMPQEVRRIFRNCRLIGRRFLLAHLLYADGKVLEVATFRAEPYDQGEGETQLITDDNQFGTPETDARRRDFTVNALFYDPEKCEVIDYVGGMDDLKKRVLRTIGDPVVRFREDPVRMLRAVKFTARTGFTLGEPERKAIRAERRQLRKAAVPRLYEEILRMLWGGAAADSFELMHELGLMEILLPEVSAWLSRKGGPDHDALGRMRAVLEALDALCGGRPKLESGVLLSALLWPLFSDLLDDLPREPDPATLKKLTEELVAPAALRLRMPRRDVSMLVAALELQLRMPHVAHKRAARFGLARHPGFPGALDLLGLRTEAFGLDQAELTEWQTLRDIPRDRDDAFERRGGSPVPGHRGRGPGGPPSRRGGAGRPFPPRR
jgi:poly(A) polymerase